MSASRPDARAFAASGGATEDEVATLERGLDALAFLERSRDLADEPVEPPAGEAPPYGPRVPACEPSPGDRVRTGGRTHIERPG